MIFDFSVLPPAWHWGLCLSVAAVIGSFLTVLTTRLPRRILQIKGPTTLGGRSYCPHCAAPIPMWRNIPVITWLVQFGRAACCSAKIPLNYFLLEAGSVLLAVAAIFDYGFTWRALAAYLLMVGVLAASCIHIRINLHRRTAH